MPTLTASATATAPDLPTATPTPTQTLVPSITPAPTSTPIPTATPEPPTATLTPEPSATATDTPIATSTDIATATATDTPLPTLEPSPTGPTPSPFPFDVRGDGASFTTNFANTAGCAWQGIGGQVFDVNGSPLTNIQVHVFGAGNFDQYTVSGSNSLYGAGGWEISVGTAVGTGNYVVELITTQGTRISSQVTVSFPGDCTRNLALVNFIQTRPF
ncbi:MAG: hypothetical protein IT320_13360 [Anaerolineae bacterium]|nr:hypothetical protein [Anaerolineae bacterium]